MDKIKTNDWCYDKDAKEYVLISNMRCPICAQGDSRPEEINIREHLLEKDHDTKYMLPFEAIALRLAYISKDGKPSFAYTHRGVRPEALEKCQNPPHGFSLILKGLKSSHFTLIGRI